VRLFERALRPEPADVGPEAGGGDPHGVVIEGDAPPPIVRPTIVPSPWSGWPSEWSTPPFSGHVAALADTAWACLDLNSGVLASMPPYLVGAADSLDAGWLENPQPAVYTAWEEFARQLFWDFQLGEAFVLATARYANGYPARFHVVPGWTVNVELAGDGRRLYSIGREDVTEDVLHLRYKSTVDDAHGHGPLEAGAPRLVAAEIYTRYGTQLATSGGIPPGTLEVEGERLSAAQAADLQAQWVASRQAGLGLPAVLSGGVKWAPSGLSPVDLALLDLERFNESRIAVLLGVPPFLVGLGSGGDPMTYANVVTIFDYHWRAGLRPKAQAVMSALSGWLLPRGTRVELNRDAYVQPGPKDRAETWKILNGIADASGPVMSVEEIRAAERLDDRVDLVQGVMQ
jgi:HK97 family phage portal protein